jgi:hypothetical protein
LVDFSLLKTISNAKLANNDFQLIVVLTLIPNREGLCAVPITSYSPSEGGCNFSVFEGAQDVAPAIFGYNVALPNFKQAKPTKLIVGCGYSEISFHFCIDCRIFCEGVKDSTIGISSNNGLVGLIGLGLVSFIGFGLISLVGLSGFGLVGLSGINGLIGHDCIVSFIGFGLLGFMDLGVAGLIDDISLIGPSGHNSLVGFMALASLA